MAHNVWLIAWRNVSRQLRRFITVISALVFGIVIISLVQGILSGIDRNIYAAAARYYGGDVLVQGTRVVPNHLDFAPAQDQASLLKLAAEKNDQIRSVKFRISVNMQGTFFFDGKYQQQKRINGIDWDKETDLLQGMDLLAKAEGLPDDNSAIISKATALRLKCDVGSSILLQLVRINGMIDTVRLTVWGIYQDAAVFGPFNAYVSRKALNKVLGNQDKDFFIFAINLKPNVNRLEFAKQFTAQISQILPSLPFMQNREEYAEKKFDITDTESHYTAMPVDYSVDQLNQISSALKSGLLILMMFIAITIAVGTFNTYRIMLNERSRELGTMRAMGLSSSGLRNLILLEGLIIALLGSICGWVVSLVVVNGLSFVSLGNIPGLDLFLSKGKLQSEVSLGQYLTYLAIMVLMLEFSAWMAARRVRNISPLEAITRS